MVVNTVAFNKGNTRAKMLLVNGFYIHLLKFVALFSHGICRPTTIL